MDINMVGGERQSRTPRSIEGTCRRKGVAVQETTSFVNLTSSVPLHGQPFPLPAQLRTSHLAGFCLDAPAWSLRSLELSLSKWLRFPTTSFL